MMHSYENWLQRLKRKLELSHKTKIIDLADDLQEECVLLNNVTGKQNEFKTT